MNHPDPAPAARRSLTGTVAVVTGGASGIGRGIAAELTTRGCRVVLADVDADALQQTAAELDATPVVADVTDPDSVAALADRTLDEHGTVHIVCNNAGVGPTGAIADLTVADWRWMFDVNLFGVVHGIQAFLPHLLANGEWGHIVNTSSMSLLAPPPGIGAYVATKAAVLGLSEVLAKELAEDEADVGVTALMPGPVTTNIKNSLRHRPSPGEHTALTDMDLAATRPSVRFVDPADVGVMVAESILERRLYAVTHDEWLPPVTQRHEHIQESFEWVGHLMASVGTGAR